MKKYEVIILSGGKGTRLNKITKKIPKCLIEFNGKPFLYYQLHYLKKNNIKNVILSVGYKARLIKEYVRKEIDFINVKIVSDGKKLLGTGGAILKSIKFLKDQFFVIYGDSYINFRLKEFKKVKKFSIMAIYKNENKYDLSNVEIMKNNFIIYDKFKKKKEYKYIDYGVSFLDKNIFKGFNKTKRFDLSVLVQKISRDRKLKGLIIKKRFFEIGSYNGIKKFDNFVKNEFYKKI